MEVFVVDGESEDKTREIVKRYEEKHPFIKLLRNEKKYTPFGLNIGIKNSKGEIIMRFDAHATYQNDYISKCVKYLNDYKADNVGGVAKATPSKNTLIAKAIALVLSHFFGAGSSAFRTGAKDVKEADTVFGGCYKREVFDRIGLYNENLIRSQDMEFNLRLKKAGGKIILVPSIVSSYYPKSNLRDFFLHNVKDGIWAVYPLKFNVPFRLRHYIPLFFVLSLIILPILSLYLYLFMKLFFFIIFFYLFSNIFLSFTIAFKENNALLFLVLPLVFLVRHIGYGLGSFFGLFKILM